jgi:hypothetical protein
MVFGAPTAVQGGFRFAGSSSSPEGKTVGAGAGGGGRAAAAAEGFAVATAMDGTEPLLAADGG